MNLNEILKKHDMWLKCKGGKQANLSYTDLECTNLRGVNLKDANLRGVNLKDSNLRYANLSSVDLSHSNLSGADLRYADLRYADLRYADLRNVDLRHADLSYANLINTDLKNVKTNINTIGYNLACPEEGSFIGYKKANDCLVKLLILKDSKRSSSTTSKCRCDKAKVLEIRDIRTGEKVGKISSNYDFRFIYKIGEIIKVDNFDDNRWNECAPGIHFFMKEEDAINY